MLVSLVQRLKWKQAQLRPRARQDMREIACFEEFSLLPGRFLLNFPDFIKSLPDASFKTLISRRVICAADKTLWQARHISEFLLAVVCVLIAFSVTHISHPTRHSVS